MQHNKKHVIIECKQLSLPNRKETIMNNQDKIIEHFKANGWRHDRGGSTLKSVRFTLDDKAITITEHYNSNEISFCYSRDGRGVVSRLSVTI